MRNGTLPLSIKTLNPSWLFPTTRYRGSKRKILPWIWENTKDLHFETVLDLFGGSGVVALLYKHMGKRVTYNDYSYFNYLSAEAFIVNSGIQLTEADINFILQIDEKRNNKFISETFREYYFLDSENEWLDGTIGNIQRLSEIYTGNELFYKKALAVWALGQSCLIKRPFNLFHRKNLNIRTNIVTRNFGNKTTWETPFSVAFQRFANEANSIVFDNGKENRGLCSDGLKYQDNNYDLVYLDPPYFFKNQTDSDYSKLYHFLDGLAQYDLWPKLINRDSHILSLQDNRVKWPTNQQQLTEIYAMLIERFKNSIIVISHKSGSLVSVDQIENLFRNQGKTVVTHKKKYSYALNKQNGNSHENSECLIVGT